MEGGTVQSSTEMMQYKKWEKGMLRPDGKPGFDTPSGKFEIASSILEEHGYDPLPIYTEPAEGPTSRSDLLRDFPLVFNSGSRVTTDFRTQHHGVPSLVKERPEPTVTINRKDADSRSIQNGDQVTLRSLRGAVTMRALVSDDITVGQVDANMGGGGPVGPGEWQNCNINDLTDLNRFDPISGFPVYKALLCEVTKVENKTDRVSIDSGEVQELSGSSKTGVQEKAPSTRIYLDHNATTHVAPQVIEVMTEFGNTCFGNPSSIYREGKEAKAALENARRSLGQLLNCTARRIIFTGGGSEANNLALKGTVFANWNGLNHIITSTIEHPAVLETCRWLEKLGLDVTCLRVGRTGLVDPEEFEEAITKHTLLASIMMANNETGSIQPIRELAEIAHRKNVIFHTDATQAVGKIPVDVKALGVDLLSMSAHKLHGPKGVGVFYMKNNIKIDPLIHGGHQESGWRAGTENLVNIVGLGKAAELALKNLPQMENVRQLRDRLHEGITELMPESSLNGHKTMRLPNTLCLTLPGMRGESVTMAMDQQGIAISSGSACRSGSPDPSHALLALGLTDEQAHCSVRLSLGIDTTAEEIDITLAKLEEVIKDNKSTIRFVPCR